jgi:hypothetical protein
MQPMQQLRSNRQNNRAFGAPFYEADKSRLKAEIDLLLTEDPSCYRGRAQRHAALHGRIELTWRDPNDNSVL